MKTVKDFNFEGKKALVRCDFNVPLDGSGNILDDFRIKKSLPTIKYLVKNGAKVILMSHLAEPDGKVVAGLSLRKIGDRLEELLGVAVKKADDCMGPDVENYVSKLNQGEILLLENLRFHKEEEENEPLFAKELSGFGDIFVNEAFSECHRNYASITGVSKYLPSCAGFLLEKEIKNLSKILSNPKRPIIALVGGAKAHDKVRFIEKILQVADFVIIGGLIKKEIKDNKLKFKNQKKIIEPSGNPADFDIDEKTIFDFTKKIMSAKTILWNGPFGKFEDDNFKKGTLKIAEAIIKSKAFSVVGGGETVEFLNKEGLSSKFNHVSTGGGAMLDFLIGEKMPGIEAIDSSP